MQNQGINRQLQRINVLITQVDKACGDNIEMRSHWAKYICLLSAGLIENAMKEIYTEFARGAASQPVANYVIAQLRHLQNPNTKKFLEIVGSFKVDWRDELESYMNSDGRKEAIDSIMTHRHRIAHGQSSNINISLHQAKEYLEKAVKVIELVEQQCAR